MRNASGQTTDANNQLQSTTGTFAHDQSYPGVDAQILTVTIVGVAGALFVFAALNMLGRTATAKVRKR